jgi:ABC-2 type transport system permease protein
LRQILAISRRETRAFFRSAMAPVLLTGFLVMTGLFFTLFAYAYSEMSRTALNTGRGGDFLNLTEGIFQPLVVDVTILLLLLLPAVTMRLLSAEYRSGRYDLIMSYPVPDHGWVLGKWLSAMTVVAVMILATGAYFGVVAILGKAEVGPVLAHHFVGGLLLRALCLSGRGLHPDAGLGTSALRRRRARTALPRCGRQCSHRAFSAEPLRTL